MLMKVSRMTRQTNCPEASIWQDLLNGDLTDSDQTGLCDHLTHCAVCRERLEAISAEADPYLKWARRGASGRSAYEPTLVHLMDRLRGRSGESTPDPQSEPCSTVCLDFLHPAVEPDEIGRLGHYAVKEVIGQGGMGIVLKAVDQTLQRVVAVKVLAPQMATHATARQRFVREARAAASIRNQHVIDIHAVEEANGIPYIVMEYINGLSLQEKLDRTGPLELKQI